MAASLTSHCPRCSKQIPGFNKLKPAACPHCWSSLSFVARRRRKDGIFRCFGCFCLCHSSFKFCEICGLSTFKGLQELTVKDKDDLHFRSVGFQTDYQGVDQEVDTSDFKETMDISGIFDDDDMLEDVLEKGSDSGGDSPLEKKRRTEVEDEHEGKGMGGSGSDGENGFLNDSGIGDSPP